jgi:transposase
LIDEHGLFERLRERVTEADGSLGVVQAVAFVHAPQAMYDVTVAEARQKFGWTLEIVRRPSGAKGFLILPRRWVVECTFGWLGRYRRLARDYEHTVASTEATTYLTSIRRMLKLATN